MTVLSHLSIQSVLEHLDYTKRASLSKRSPTIASIENRIPLKIDTLHVLPLGFKINNTTYKLGISRHYHDRSNPNVIKRMNDAGGLQVEIDEYGFDLRLKNCDRSPQILSKCIAEMRDSIDFERNQLKFDINAPRPGYESIVVERHNRMAEENEEEIVRLSMLRDQTPPTFFHFIQLLSMASEHVVYTNTLKESRDYLVKRLFQQYPNGRKIRVRHFRTEESKIWKLFENVIQFEKYPLESLEYSRCINHPMVQTAYKFVYTGNKSFDQNYGNHRVHIKRAEFNRRDFNSFISMCTSQLNYSGKHYSVETPNLDNAREFYGFMKELRNGRVEEDVELSDTPFSQYVIVPQRNNLEIKFSVTTIRGEDDGKKTYHFNAKAYKKY